MLVADTLKSHRSHSCYVTQGLLHAVHAPAGYVRLLAGCALVQAAIDKMIAIRWRHMLQRAQWHDSCLCTHFVARCRFDAKTTPCAPLIHCPSARAQQLRVHSVQALLHRLAVRHHFESLQLAVSPAMHKYKRRPQRTGCPHRCSPSHGRARARGGRRSARTSKGAKHAPHSDVYLITHPPDIKRIKGNKKKRTYGIWELLCTRLGPHLGLLGTRLGVSCRRP